MKEKTFCDGQTCPHKHTVKCVEIEVEIDTDSYCGTHYVHLCKECLIEALAELNKK